MVDADEVLTGPAGRVALYFVAHPDQVDGLLRSTGVLVDAVEDAAEVSRLARTGGLLVMSDDGLALVAARFVRLLLQVDVATLAAAVEAPEGPAAAELVVNDAVLVSGPWDEDDPGYAILAAEHIAATQGG